jgi:DEAD/DEAH box helicase domain-containing protein
LLSQTRKKTLRSQDEGGGRDVTVHDDICPVCGARDGQLILGAQTTSIAAHAVERLWSAPLNRDKKLILFSDSVQDAAHRAGFVESKTENWLVRAGLAKVLAALPTVLPWDQALDALGHYHLDSSHPLYLAPREFVARFIPPAMEWMRDWKTLTALAAASGHGGDARMMVGMAFRELAENAEKIGELNISPDLLRALLDAPPPSPPRKA